MEQDDVIDVYQDSRADWLEVNRAVAPVFNFFEILLTEVFSQEHLIFSMTDQPTFLQKLF